jgi:hypothetical protein
MRVACPHLKARHTNVADEAVAVASNLLRDIASKHMPMISPQMVSGTGGRGWFQFVFGTGVCVFQHEASAVCRICIPGVADQQTQLCIAQHTKGGHAVLACAQQTAQANVLRVMPHV